MEIKIDYDKCCWKNGKCSSGCGCNDGNCCEGCVEACPVQAITRKDKVEIDKKTCILCGACVNACSKKAISLI